MMAWPRTLSEKENAIVETDKAIEEGQEAIYYEEGTEIRITIRSVVEGKYEIILSGDIAMTGERIEESIILDSDKVIEVRVEAKRYNVVVEEYIYRDLSEQESGTPSREENPINGIEMGGQGYGENATLRFSKGNTDRELTKIVLTETGIGKIELTIRDGVYEVSGEGEIEGTENGYIIRIGEKEYTLIDNEDTIELRYETEDNITLRLEYTSLKEISP